MSKLVPFEPGEVAIGETAVFTIVHDGGPKERKVELWQRLVEYESTQLPKFMHAGLVSSTQNESHDVALGDLFQAVLYREGQGNPSGTGDILGKVDFPSIDVDARENFLTACAKGMPQLEITTGGTFVSMSFATSVLTRARVQVGTREPELDTRGLPVMPSENVVASAASQAPKLLHELHLVDELLQFDTDDHTPLETDQELFFVILVWNEDGYWDFIWSTKGVAPANAPERIRTKKRVVRTRLSRLICHDDSDDLSDGEAEFNFIVLHGGGETVKTVSWNPMATGGQKRPPIGTASVQVDHPDSATGVAVRVDGVEDDSGSFPPDDDDKASTHGLSGGTSLNFPVGSRTEVVPDTLLVLRSERTTFSELFEFTAEVIYSVDYDV